MPKSPAIQLPENFYDCERGNIYLLGPEDQHIAWFRLGEVEGVPVWLQVSLVPQNYPGFEVSTLHQSEEDLAEHIRTKLTGWFAKKLNIEGVPLSEEGYVQDEEG